MWDLKEAAKWSSTPEEKKAAIKTLSARGQEAVPTLEEVMSTTAYDDIRAACMEAIKSAKNMKTVEGEKPAGPQGETAAERLADLPP
jgi:hypothetical protein